jgi:hypothetical protein
VIPLPREQSLAVLDADDRSGTDQPVSMALPLSIGPGDTFQLRASSRSRTASANSLGDAVVAASTIVL